MKHVKGILITLAFAAAQVDDSGLDTSICGDHGYPKNNDGSRDRWALERYYCMISTDDGSEETLPGAFTEVYQFSCALDKLVKYDGVQREIDAPVTEACFGHEILATFQSLGINSVKLLATGTTPSSVQPGIWAQSLEFQVSPNDPNVQAIGAHYFNVYVKRSATEISFASTGGVKASGQKDSFAVNLNLATGKLRFEAVNQRYGVSPESCGDGSTGCAGWNNHTRLVATGTVDESGLFSSVL